MPRKKNSRAVMRKTGTDISRRNRHGAPRPPVTGTRSKSSMGLLKTSRNMAPTLAQKPGMVSKSSKGTGRGGAGTSVGGASVGPGISLIRRSGRKGLTYHDFRKSLGWIPSFSRRESRVEGASPATAAAPSAPAILPRQWWGSRSR